jgi:hypothetical protein
MRVSQDGPSAPGLGSKVYGKHATHDIFEACGWEQIPGYLIRDRDRAYGEIFVRRVRSIGIRDRPTSFCSPFAERLIGSIRGECLDHIIVLGEAHLRRMPRGLPERRLGEDHRVTRDDKKGAASCGALLVLPFLDSESKRRSRSQNPNPTPENAASRWS